MILKFFLLRNHTPKCKLIGYMLEKNDSLLSIIELQYRSPFKIDEITPETIRSQLAKNFSQSESYIQIYKSKESIIENFDYVLINNTRYLEGDKVKSPKLFGDWVVKKGLYTPNKNSAENISGDGSKMFGWYISNEEYQNSIEGSHYNEYEIAKFPILKLEIYQMQEEIRNDFLSEKEIKDTDGIVNLISKTTKQTELITNYLKKNIDEPISNVHIKNNSNVEYSIRGKKFNQKIRINKKSITFLENNGKKYDTIFL